MPQKVLISSHEIRWSSMTINGTDLPIKHTHVNDCFLINTAEIRCKKLKIFNEPGTGSPVSQISGQSIQYLLSLESTPKRT
jgi:hypothetical protein